MFLAAVLAAVIVGFVIRVRRTAPAPTPADVFRASAGELGVFLLRAVAKGRAKDLLPAGLSCEVLFGGDSQLAPAVRDAAVRLEKVTDSEAAIPRALDPTR